MLRVRFPTGLVVIYNRANFIKIDSFHWGLYESDGGKWIASVQASSGAIVEAVPACDAYMEPEDQKLKILADTAATLIRKITLLERRLKEWEQKQTSNGPKRRGTR